MKMSITVSPGRWAMERERELRGDAVLEYRERVSDRHTHDHFDGDEIDPANRRRSPLIDSAP